MATTVTKTIKASGGDYTSLSAWEAGQQGDLTGVRDEIARAVCYAIDDTTAVTVSGWTTSATQYITIEVDSTARHAGVWDGDKYNLSSASGDTLIVQTSYVRVAGMQISTTRCCVVATTWGAVGTPLELRLCGNIFKGGGAWSGLVQIADTYFIGDALVYSNLFYDGATNAFGVNHIGANTDCYIYNNTFRDMSYGIERAGGDVYVKNNLFSNCTTATEGLTAANCGYNATNNASLGYTAQTGDRVSQTFTFADAANDDFHLDADDAGALDYGVDLSGVFTTDIDGDTIVNWSIGADDGTAGATAYTLSCAGGTYALTGTVVSPLRGAKVDAAGGSYALTGAAAGTLKGSKVGADAGSYALTGQDAGAYYGRAIDADAGAYALAGTAVGLLRTARIVPEAGVYALTGADAALLYGRAIDADAGVYLLTGQDVVTLRDALINAYAGEYHAESKIDTPLLYGRLINAEAGTYAVVGQDVTLTYVPGLAAYILSCEGGAYAIVGGDVELRRDAKITAETGAYTVTGQAALTLLGRLLDAGAGSYAITGQAATLLRNATLPAGEGTYLITGADADLLWSGVIAPPGNIPCDEWASRDRCGLLGPKIRYLGKKCAPVGPKPKRCPDD